MNTIFTIASFLLVGGTGPTQPVAAGEVLAPYGPGSQITGSVSGGTITVSKGSTFDTAVTGTDFDDYITVVAQPLTGTVKSVGNWLDISITSASPANPPYPSSGSIINSAVNAQTESSETINFLRKAEAESNAVYPVYTMDYYQVSDKLPATGSPSSLLHDTNVVFLAKQVIIGPPIAPPPPPVPPTTPE